MDKHMKQQITKTHKNKQTTQTTKKTTTHKN